MSFGFGRTKSGRRFSRAPLTRFIGLHTLFIEGHTKDIEAVSSLVGLEDQSLRSITLPDLTMLLPLKRLRSLDIKLGGTSNLAMLPCLDKLRYLEVWQVRGLSNLDSVGEVPTLQFVFLQSLRQVERLPSFVRCDSCGAMQDIGQMGERISLPGRMLPAMHLPSC